MRKLILLIVFYSLSLQSQQINPKTISLSENPTNAELEFLKEELKNKQVVLLGENAHFDGNIFECRNKIIEFLFDEMGFTTIAFESGIYDIYKAEQEIKSGENIDFAFQNSLMGAWGYAKETMEIVGFYKKYNPKIFGFDNQFTNNYGFDSFHKDLYAYLEKQKIDFPFDKEDFELLLESLNQSYTFDEGDISFSKFENYFKKVLSELRKLQKNKENFYWVQIIESFLIYTKDIYATKNFWTPFSLSTKDNIRDKQMAKNLLEYIKTHPEEKIVCWGANGHFIANMNGVTHKKLQNVYPMGTYLKKELGDKVYSLAGVTAVKEVSYDGKVYKTPIDSLSFEFFQLKKKGPVTFIRAQQKALEIPMQNRIFADDKFTLANMSSLFDGYLFFKNYKISTSIDVFKSSKKKDTKEVTILKGKVIDAKTRKPLEMAEITIPKLFKSVFTNKQGEFEFTIPINSSVQKLQVNYLGYESKEVLVGKHKLIKLKESENLLDEVIVKSNKQALRTLKDVIKKIDKNYQTTPMNYKAYTHTDYKVEDSSYLKAKIITNHYSRGFMSRYRPAHKVEQVYWVKPNKKKRPKNIRELMQYYGFYQAFFNKRKLKKFSLQFENDTIINNRKITVISFSTPRQQYTYTLKSYKCKYNGKVYVDNEDKAIIRFEEDFKVTEFTLEDLQFGWYLPFKNNLKRFEMLEEKKIVNYQKHNNKKYYVSSIQSSSKAKAYPKKNKKYIAVSRNIEQFFFEYDYKGSSFFEHQKYDTKSFKGVKYNKFFWDKFDLKNLLKK